MTHILDGKILSENILSELSHTVKQRALEGKKIPHLAAVLVGTDAASETYVASKVNHCKKIGFQSTLIRLPTHTQESELLRIIDALNSDADIDGYIVQLPLPAHIHEYTITQAIHPDKDVDGFHPANIGKLALGLPTFISATPNGIIEIFKRYAITTEGKNCVVVGRSNIVGTPMALLMSRAGNPGNATVTICHSKTKNLTEITRQADILIVAMGKPEYINKEHVKQGAVVIDVGIHRIPDSDKKSGYRLVGDVSFQEVAPLASYITPVPGGVGLMTICSLLQNTLKACSLKD